MNPASPSEFHLLPTRSADGDGSRGDPIRLPLRAARLPANGVSHGPPDPTFEPLRSKRHQHRLLALFPRGCRPLVNGDPAPPIVVLSPGDRISWGQSKSFAVAVYHRPEIGPPPASSVGRPCPTCRVPLAADTRTLTCPCGVSLHCELDAKDGLQCARVSPNCPVCHRPLVLTEGYQEAGHADD